MATMTRLNFDQSEHIMGPGSHVGFPISTKNKNLVYDHPMNVSAKFDSNLFGCFRKKDENVFLLETTKPNELWLCRNDH
jgi:hypothetical protein